ncbi:MAG: hypothetical protein M3238_05315 [Actinomycetota bacterium]|nr:hypothetical protein [Actinomycetota bacterium]
MTSGILAAFIGVLAFGFVEGLGRFYPARETWRRLRRARGRLAVRLMRQRFEQAAARRSPKVLAIVSLVAVGGWIAVASLFDKRWYEVVADVLPWAVVAIALFRTPHALGDVAERMREYEREVGEDPDAELHDLDGGNGDGGPSAIAL